MKIISVSSALVLIILLLSNCKKDKDRPLEESPTAAEYFMPLKVGNYWIYKREMENGNYPDYTISTTYDSVRITRDTVINGRTYFEIKGGLFLGLNGLFADSSGYIINGTGQLYPLSTRANDTVSISTDPGGAFSFVFRTGNVNTSITTGAGSFSCTQMILDFYYNTSSPPIPNHNPRMGYTYYSENIGIVKCETFYAAQSGKTILELEGYYIQP